MTSSVVVCPSVPQLDDAEEQGVSTIPQTELPALPVQSKERTFVRPVSTEPLTELAAPPKTSKKRTVKPPCNIAKRKSRPEVSVSSDSDCQIVGESNAFIRRGLPPSLPPSSSLLQSTAFIGRGLPLSVPQFLSSLPSDQEQSLQGDDGFEPVTPPLPFDQ